jgi:ribonuclease HI
MSDDGRLFAPETDDHTVDDIDEGGTASDVGGVSRPVVYTDGACLGNPGPGGWGWAHGKARYASGAEAKTTNQRMELTAVLEALRATPGRVEVVSDSTYVVNCFRDRWWQGWRRRGWRNSKGDPVANRDLWEPLVAEVIDLRRDQEVVFRWVKGHSGEEMNEFVDLLATTAARSQQGVRVP